LLKKLPKKPSKTPCGPTFCSMDQNPHCARNYDKVLSKQGGFLKNLHRLFWKNLCCERVANQEGKMKLV
jgi:hypothetical protein